MILVDENNLKILKGKLIASNQNKTLYFFDKTNGELLKKIPTEETIIKNHFINNLSSNGQNTIFFLNSGKISLRHLILYSESDNIIFEFLYEFFNLLKSSVDCI